MSGENVWEAAKTSAKMLFGTILALSILILLVRFNLIEIDYEMSIEPTILMIFLGVLMSIGILAYFLDQLEWL